MCSVGVADGDALVRGEVGLWVSSDVGVAVVGFLVGGGSVGERVVGEKVGERLVGRVGAAVATGAPATVE